MTRRKIKKSVLRKFLWLIVLTFAVVISYKGYKSFFADKKGEDTKTTNIFKEDKKNKDPEVYKLKFLATGDGLVHSVIYNTYKKDNGYDFSGALAYVKDIVSEYDLAYYNQETPMGDNSIDYSGYPRFYTPKEYGDAMIDIGFNMISLASNHSYDKGEKGIRNTLNYIKTKDILYSGMNETEEDTKNYIIKEKNNITYSMLSYTTLDNGLSSLLNGKNYMVNKYSNEKAKEDIEYLKDKVDVLIVAMHWGTEYVVTPTKEQKEIAEYLASLGVDIVVGNHSHVLEPITKIGDTIVMYSLGNFISNQYGTDDWNKLVGFLATVEITKTVEPNKDTKIEFSNLGGELIFTSYEGNPISTPIHSGHKVIPFSKMTDERYLKDYRRVYDKYSKVLTSMGMDLNIAPLPN